MGKHSKYKIAIMEDNPVHYRLPIHRAIAKNKKINITVYFCTTNDSSERYRYETSSKKGLGLKLYGFNYILLKNYYPFKEKIISGGSWGGLWNFGIVTELIKNKYDAVIIYGYSSFSKKLAYLGAKLSGTPIIFREAITESTGGKIKRVWKKIFYTLLFKIPDVFLYSCTENKEFYQKFGVPEKKLIRHPCSVDNKFYGELSRKIKKKNIRKKLGIPIDANVFLSVGTIDKRKFSFATLKAFEPLAQKNNYLIFLGEGPEKEKLQKCIEDKKISNVMFFKFKSNHEKVAEFYSVADVYVIASTGDPEPKALNEAMNFPVAVIASTGVGTASDLIKNGKNGFIFEKGDYKQLRKCMEKIISDKKKLKRMGFESMKIISEWTPEEDAEATVKALDYIYENEKTNFEK